MHGLFALLFSPIVLSVLVFVIGIKIEKEELRKAFKVRMMMNHPDKLSTLDPELQKIASDRTIAIKDAFANPGTTFLFFTPFTGVVTSLLGRGK